MKSFALTAVAVAMLFGAGSLRADQDAPLDLSMPLVTAMAPAGTISYEEALETWRKGRASRDELIRAEDDWWAQRFGEFALAASGQPAKPPALPGGEVSVSGPSQVQPGQMAAFRLDGLPAKYVDAFDWVVFRQPADATVLDLSDRRTGAPVLVFQSATPGNYAVIADVNVEPLSDCRLIVHEFIVGKPSPNPDPDPTPDPDPVPDPPDSDIAKQVLSWTKKVAGDDDVVRSEAKKLAAAYRKIAADIAARTIVRRDAVPGAVAAANSAVLGTRGTAWRPFFTEYAASLDKWEGPERKISEIARVLIETAEGWEALK